MDQNGDDRLAPIIARYAERLPLLWLRSDRANACHARNLGLCAGARARSSAFRTTIASIRRACWRGWRRPSPPIPRSQVLTGPAASPAGGLGSGRWRRDGGPITPANVWTSVIEFNLFLRRDTALALGGFDERLGPGTPFGSAEGNDLVLRAVAAGHKAVYDPELRVVHPDKRMTAAAAERARLYGTGLGFVLRRHRVPALGVAALLRPAARRRGAGRRARRRGRGAAPPGEPARALGRASPRRAAPAGVPLPPIAERQRR